MNRNTGAAILAMGELSRIESKARDAEKVAQAANVRASNAGYSAALAGAMANALEEAAKSQIHNFRSQIDAHAITEDELIAALKAENPKHPLADREVVNQIFEANRAKTDINPDTIKKTYPDGVIPANLFLEDGTVGSLPGEPAYPGPSRADRLAAEARSTMMTALNLSDADMDDESKLQALIVSQTASAAEMDMKLADDKGKFFGMSGKKRAEMDEQVAGVKMNIDQLKLAVSQIPVRAEAARSAIEKAEQVEAAKVKLAAWRSSQGAPKG